MNRPPISPGSDERARFRPVAEEYRWRVRVTIGLFLLGLAVGAAAVFVVPDYPTLCLVLFMLCMAAALVVQGRGPALLCPGCGAKVDGEAEVHCAVCGGKALEQHRWLGPRCSGCRAWLSNNEGRNYRVRFCTHCGAWLDERGV